MLTCPTILLNPPLHLLVNQRQMTTARLLLVIPNPAVNLTPTFNHSQIYTTKFTSKYPSSQPLSLLQQKSIDANVNFIDIHKHLICYQLYHHLLLIQVFIRVTAL